VALTLGVIIPTLRKFFASQGEKQQIEALPPGRTQCLGRTSSICMQLWYILQTHIWYFASPWYATLFSFSRAKTHTSARRS